MLTIHNQLHHQKRHETSFSIVHEVAIAHPFLGFTADYTLLVGFPSSREERFLCCCVVAEVIEQVLDDNAGLGEHDGLLVWRGVRGLDGQ